MQNKGFLDFIEKLQAAANGQKAERPSSEPNSVSNSKQSYSNNAAKQKNDRKNDESSDVTIGNSFIARDKNAEHGGNPFYPADEKSYIKTYNPFGEALSPRPQISAPRAKKQPKEKIDLSVGKNLAGEKKSEVSKNMLDLIKRHNALSLEIKSGDKNTSTKNAADIKKR